MNFGIFHSKTFGESHQFNLYNIHIDRDHATSAGPFACDLAVFKCAVFLFPKIKYFPKIVVSTFTAHLVVSHIMKRLTDDYPHICAHAKQNYCIVNIADLIGLHNSRF